MIKNEVLVQSPTRIDFSGGTLDCWPINALLSPVTTVNAAISIFTTCRLSKREDEKIVIHSRELDRTFEFANLASCLSSEEKEFRFFQEHIRYWSPDFGFQLSAQSESPMGGGLGGSSSLSISIFKAFSELMQTQMSDHEIVRFCSGIEAKILDMPTGTQDYYPPLKGGINIIDYQFGEPSVQVLSASDLKISDRISVFFTGKSHHSGINNWQVLKDFVNGDVSTRKALTEIQKISEQVRTCVLENRWDDLPPLFKKEFEVRMTLTSSFSSPEIEQLAEIAYAQGADAINICGAGGGGCVFIWSQPEKKTSIIEACSQAGFQYLNVELI